MNRTLTRDLIPIASILLLQLCAAIFFIGDAITDEYEPGGGSTEALIEAFVAVALIAGVVIGAVQVARLVRENRRRAQTVAIARGALADILIERFSDWQLSRAEADVALFALKGCTVAEIANMRSAATGTVRAQLSQVYAKAGVSSQSMLMSLFLDELMDKKAD